MFLKLIVLLALIGGALLLTSTLSRVTGEGKSQARFWPLLAVAGLALLMFWKHVVSLALIIVIGVLVLVALLRRARRQLFGSKNVSLWTVATIIFIVYYGLVLLYRLVLLRQMQ